MRISIHPTIRLSDDAVYHERPGKRPGIADNIDEALSHTIFSAEAGAAGLFSCLIGPSVPDL